MNTHIYLHARPRFSVPNVCVYKRDYALAGLAPKASAALGMSGCAVCTAALTACPSVSDLAFRCFFILLFFF